MKIFTLYMLLAALLLLAACQSAEQATPTASQPAAATDEHVTEPTVEPAAVLPTLEPTAEPAEEPAAEPAAEPVVEPTAETVEVEDVADSGSEESSRNDEGSEEPSYPLAEPDYTNKRPLDFTAFEDALDTLSEERLAELDELVIEATVPQLQAAFSDGSLTSEALVTYYIWRIREYDLNRLNSVMELNQDVLEIAREKDGERAAGGEFGDMHGIPTLLKDNIAAAGGNMHWTAGAWAMRDLVPDRDALLVQQLRDSGAIIMGKANLSEWANWIDLDMPNGFSTLGGQARHPYGPFDPQGSSSGPAVSAAANFTAVSVGTETSGSIISPAKLPVSELAIGLILAPGFKIDWNLLLSQLGDLAPHPSLEAIITANDEDSANPVPYGQDSLILSQESAMTEEEYRQGFDEGRVTVIDRVNQVIDNYDIDVLYADLIAHD